MVLRFMRCFWTSQAFFYPVRHKRLLHKLCNSGILGSLLPWYLSNKKQMVVIDGNYFSWLKISSCVPQGFILRPLLFNSLFLISDLPEVISST